MIDHIESRYQFYKAEIRKQSSPERKQLLATDFYNDLNANMIHWKEYLRNDGNKIVGLFGTAFDDIRFQGESRWFPGGLWTYSGDRKRWNREWFDGDYSFRNQAKARVTERVRETINELSESLTSKIKQLFGELQTMANE